MKIKSEKRNIAVYKIVVPPPVKKEPTVSKNPTNIFASAQPKPQTTNSANNSKDVKVKEEKTSPKQSPKKNQPAAKPSAKAQQGKTSSSIASFFAKPSTSTTHDKSISNAAKKIEKVQIKDEPADTVKRETANTNKRQLSNASGKRIFPNFFALLNVENSIFDINFA